MSDKELDAIASDILQDNKDDDFYYVENTPYIRVTRVLNVIAKPRLYAWYGKYGTVECRRISKERKAFGTRMHKYFENYLKGKEPDERYMEPEERSVFFTFRDWIEERKVEPMFLEKQVVSKYGYGGTIDFVGKVDGVLTIIDWKTAKDIYDDYPIQLGAYYNGLKEVEEIDVESGIIVTFRNLTAKPIVLTRQQLNTLFKIFLAAYRVCQYKKFGIEGLKI